MESILDYELQPTNLDFLLSSEQNETRAITEQNNIEHIPIQPEINCAEIQTAQVNLDDVNSEIKKVDECFQNVVSNTDIPNHTESVQTSI
ncbi:hypothetical protein CEXT_792941 [Caerostris extrusa]|uniref:Uncharacterized protein n=1 Tax=Caerostris extrusa TaxID=172846 RepID=A0AAV4T4M4_CAEEX|nr:hypothetical protein CEXT_792941 [Caerostris extrusa]